MSSLGICGQQRYPVEVSLLVLGSLLDQPSELEYLVVRIDVKVWDLLYVFIFGDLITSGAWDYQYDTVLLQKHLAWAPCGLDQRSCKITGDMQFALFEFRDMWAIENLDFLWQVAVGVRMAWNLDFLLLYCLVKD